MSNKRMHRCWLSISDDDLCAHCAHLYYNPGERSQCQCPDTSHDKDDWPDWPAAFDADQYADSCPLYAPKQEGQPAPAAPASPRARERAGDAGVYYRAQLDSLLPVRPVYGATVKFGGCADGSSTNTLNLNRDSIPVIIAWLTEHAEELCAVHEGEACPKS